MSTPPFLQPQGFVPRLMCSSPHYDLVLGDISNCRQLCALAGGRENLVLNSENFGRTGSDLRLQTFYRISGLTQFKRDPYVLRRRVNEQLASFMIR